MIKLTVLYRKPNDLHAFDDYYSQTHAPLAAKLPGLRKYEIAKVADSLVGTSPYYLIAELYFDDKTQLEAALGSPEGRIAAKDVANFAKDLVEMFVAEVEEKVLVGISGGK